MVFTGFSPPHQDAIEQLVEVWQDHKIVSGRLLRLLNIALEYGETAPFESLYGERPVASYLPNEHQVVFYKDFFNQPREHQNHIALHEMVVHPLLELYKGAGYITEEEWIALGRAATQRSHVSDLPYVTKLVRRYNNPQEIKRYARLSELGAEQYKSQLRELIVLETIAERLTAWLLNKRQGADTPYAAFLQKHFFKDTKIIRDLGQIAPATIRF